MGTKASKKSKRKKRLWDCYWQGVDAAVEQGKPITANPYDQATENSEYAAWRCGYWGLPNPFCRMKGANV